MTTPDEPEDWIVEWPAKLSPMVDLFCLPGAGAGASQFRAWTAGIAPFASLLAGQLPGREERLDAPLYTSLDACARALTDGLLARRTRPGPLVLCGHSMGGTLAYEIALRLAELERPADAIILMASSPPRGASAEFDDAALAELLVRYDPANAILIEQPELFQALSDRLRADIRMLPAHRIDGPLPAPIGESLLLAGADDTVVPLEAVRTWARYLPPECTCEVIDGGHTFAFDRGRSAVLSLVNGVLARAAGLKRGS